MSIVLDGTTGLAGAATGALNGTLGATTPSTVVATSVNTPNTFGFKNLLIDAGFTINQRAYVSGATLSSGSYGHDRWKAGASGGDYTFTQLASSTTITIASGKSLIQVVEDKNVNGTSFVLSWTGTAQARYAVNGATPSGSYAASPILITGQTVGTTMSVEFNTGTLSKPQLELGSTATSFDVRDYGRELAMCQRYYETNFQGVAVPTNTYAGYVQATVGTNTYAGGGANINQALGPFNFKVSKRASPTVTVYSYASSTVAMVGNGWTGADLAANTGAVNNASPYSFSIVNSSGGNVTTTSSSVIFNFAATAEL